MATTQPAIPAAARPGGVTRWVDQAGKISLAGFSYHVGRVFAGELVEAVCRQGLVEIRHGGVLLATHTQRRRPDQRASLRPEAVARWARAATVGQPVTRVVDSGGNVSFAEVSYRAGRGYARRSVQVALVGGSVQLSIDGRVIRVHPARHDPAKEHGAFATPTGGHDGKALLSPSTRSDQSAGYRSQPVARVPDLDSGHSQPGCDHLRPPSPLPAASRTRSSGRRGTHGGRVGGWIGNDGLAMLIGQR
jgi:hypothetical protein